MFEHDRKQSTLAARFKTGYGKKKIKKIKITNKPAVAVVNSSVTSE